MNFACHQIAERRIPQRGTKAQPKSKQADKWCDNAEPSLAELIEDPVFQMILRRDGLTRQDVLAVVEQWRRQTSPAQ